MHVGAFLAIFPIFLGFVGIFWGTPAIYFADFGAILAIFDHFWAILGPFLGRKKKLAFFAEKWHFGPEISAEAQKHRIQKLYTPPRGESQRYSSATIPKPAPEGVSKRGPNPSLHARSHIAARDPFAPPRMVPYDPLVPMGP